jgi:molybdopterin-guanine dinucleotide biosynthesis protein A
MTLGAVILAGGASRRMGEDKATLLWGGERAVDRVARLATDLGARHLVVAGGDYGWPFVLDPRPQAGPCAGVSAGAGVLRAAGCSRMIVLAVDAPTLAPDDLAPLLAAPLGAAYRGFPIPFAAPLASLPADIASDMPLRRLIERLGLTQIEPSEAVARRVRGANTPAERAALMGLDAAPKGEAPNI